jgi:hypothetical protein
MPRYAVVIILIGVLALALGIGITCNVSPSVTVVTPSSVPEHDGGSVHGHNGGDQ